MYAFNIILFTLLDLFGWQLRPALSNRYSLARYGLARGTQDQHAADRPRLRVCMRARVMMYMLTAQAVE